MNAQVLLEVHELTVGHGSTPLLRDLSFALQAGKLTAMIGVNGVGKSTVLKTLAGLIPPLAGDIRVQGTGLSTLNAAERSRMVSIVLTGRPRTGMLDVETIVALGRQPWTGRWGSLSSIDRDQVTRAISLVGAEHLRRRSLHTCSDGEGQKVLIARALAQATPVMLLDEPTAFLDLPNRVEIVRMLRRIALEERKAVLYSTHDLQLALDVSDRLLLFRRDDPPWTGTPSEAVSSGVLAAAFAGSGIRFDPGSGAHRFER